MSANISFVNGRAEFASALRPAWWDAASEYVLPEVPTSADMITAAHLDWEVEMSCCRDEKGKALADYCFTRRQDTGTVLGCGMTSDYRVVQNKEAFSFLDSLLQDGVMRYESAGALDGGRTVWALARMPSVDNIAEGDDSLRYNLFLNSHDAGGSLFIIPTSVRVVCANTARIATKGQRGIRHTGDMDYKLNQAKLMLSQYDQQFTLFRDNARKLASMKWSSDAAKAYITTLFPEVKEEGKAKTIREKKVQEVRDALRADRQTLPSIKGTWWSLYNAVSEAVDHGNIFRTTGKGVQRAERKFANVAFGNGADFKQQAFDLALSMAV